MKVNDKLARLLRLHNAAAVAQAAGLSSASVRGYVAGRHCPGLDAIRSLARVLDVEWTWLADDAQDWPPVRVAESVEAATPAA